MGGSSSSDDALQNDIRQLILSINTFINAQSQQQVKLEERLHTVELTCAGFPDFDRMESRIDTRLDDLQKTLTTLSNKVGEMRGGNKWTDYLVQVGLSCVVSGTMVFFIAARSG